MTPFVVLGLTILAACGSRRFTSRRITPMTFIPWTCTTLHKYPPPLPGEIPQDIYPLGVYNPAYIPPGHLPPGMRSRMNLGTIAAQRRDAATQQVRVGQIIAGVILTNHIPLCVILSNQIPPCVILSNHIPPCVILSNHITLLSA